MQIHWTSKLTLKENTIVLSPDATRALLPGKEIDKKEDMTSNLTILFLKKSGHLARHNRIHTGEKNFHCLHPGCPSRFSRQDNMMQHYRTHLSQKARRQQQQLKKPAQKPSSPFYCHSDEGMKLARPMTRPRRSITMPSLPYPMFDARQQDRPSVRPRRALSTSSTCSSSSSFISSSHPSPQFNQLLPPLSYLYQQHYQPVELSQFALQKPTQWEPKPTEKSLSSLLYLANIVSTFG